MSMHDDNDDDGGNDFSMQGMGATPAEEARARIEAARARATGKVVAAPVPSTVRTSTGVVRAPSDARAAFIARQGGDAARQATANAAMVARLAVKSPVQATALANKLALTTRRPGETDAQYRARIAAAGGAKAVQAAGRYGVTIAGKKVNLLPAEVPAAKAIEREISIVKGATAKINAKIAEVKARKSKGLRGFLAGLFGMGEDQIIGSDPFPAGQTPADPTIAPLLNDVTATTGVGPNDLLIKILTAPQPTPERCAGSKIKKKDRPFCDFWKLSEASRQQMNTIIVILMNAQSELAASMKNLLALIEGGGVGGGPLDPACGLPWGQCQTVGNSNYDPVTGQWIGAGLDPNSVYGQGGIDPTTGMPFGQVYGGNEIGYDPLAYQYGQAPMGMEQGGVDPMTGGGAEIGNAMDFQGGGLPMVTAFDEGSSAGMEWEQAMPEPQYTQGYPQQGQTLPMLPAPQQQQYTPFDGEVYGNASEIFGQQSGAEMFAEGEETDPTPIDGGQVDPELDLTDGYEGRGFAGMRGLGQIACCGVNDF